VSYVLIDLTSCHARLARAGLSAPVVVNQDRPQRLTPIDCEGMVMGIDKGPIFNSSLEARAFEIHPGDLLVLFTKGVIEARGSGRDEFGIYRMHGLCERYGSHEAAYFVDKFKEYFNLHIQRRRDTDACVMALKRKGV
jgi:serine phosphatase RsbU (regulator of sigma subunit)